MRLIIPFASVLPQAGLEVDMPPTAPGHAMTAPQGSTLPPWNGPAAAALRSLSLPKLDALLQHAVASERDAGDAYSLSPPHERALARALGFAGADGLLPWAAWNAQRDGIDTRDLAWGEVTPVHWHVGADQVALVDPHALDLNAAESRELFDAVRPLFESEGLVLAFGAPLRWYAAHTSLSQLPTASIDRVISRNVDRWLPDAAQARLIRRLQSEAQMLLHQHSLNEAREARGALPVNSFWLSGCGARQAATMPPDLRVDDRLRAPALAGDWLAWQQAWRDLDAGPVADALVRVQRGEVVCVTLCGDSHAAELSCKPQGLWQRLKSTLRSTSAMAVLETI